MLGWQTGDANNVLASYIIAVIIKEISLFLENKNRKTHLSSEILSPRLQMSMANCFLVLLFFKHGNDMERETTITMKSKVLRKWIVKKEKSITM